MLLSKSGLWAKRRHNVCTGKAENLLLVQWQSQGLGLLGAEKGTILTQLKLFCTHIVSSPFPGGTLTLPLLLWVLRLVVSPRWWGWGGVLERAVGISSPSLGQVRRSR